MAYLSLNICLKYATILRPIACFSPQDVIQTPCCLFGYLFISRCGCSQRTHLNPSFDIHKPKPPHVTAFFDMWPLNSPCDPVAPFDWNKWSPDRRLVLCLIVPFPLVLFIGSGACSNLGIRRALTGRKYPLWGFISFNGALKGRKSF